MSLPQCICMEAFGHDCAHFLSNYMITQLGHKDLAVPEKNGPITQRCQQKRPIRAKDMRNWMAMRYTKKNKLDQDGWYFFYEESDINGRGHVGMIKIKLVKDKKGNIVPDIVDSRIQGVYYTDQDWEIEYYFYK